MSATPLTRELTPAPSRVPRIADAVAAQCSQRIAAGSKSFALAGRLLPRRSRHGAFVVYAWCRRADDAIDQRAPAEQGGALRQLDAEIDALFRGDSTGDATLDAFGLVAAATAIPAHYPREMLAGMAMDIEAVPYPDLASLMRYCYRVAGTVGLMMSHVMGLRSDSALHAAAHLGMAMQLTNICRDVLEDWRLGRLYLPQDLLHAAGLDDLRQRLGTPFPAAARDPLRGVLAATLTRAGRYYRAAERGFLALPWQAALSIRAARSIYAAIGGRIAGLRYDVLAGRAVVPLAAKLGAVAGALAQSVCELPDRARALPGHFTPPDATLTFEEIPLL